jgi:hypothetical protein
MSTRTISDLYSQALRGITVPGDVDRHEGRYWTLIRLAVNHRREAELCDRFGLYAPAEFHKCKAICALAAARLYREVTQ